MTTAVHRSREEVVIVGGGFCGSTVARKLDAQPAVNVTLVDSEAYFEYIPGIPRIPFDSDAVDKLTVSYEQFLPQTRCIDGKVTEVTPESVRVGDERIPFDICLIATGSTQPIQLSNNRDVHTLMWVSDAQAIRRELPGAQHILIVGGGVLGTEFAAELATRTPDKKVTVVEGMGRLLERNPPGASEYARRFLETRDVDIIFEDLVFEHEGDEYVTRDGKRVRADMAVWCAGPSPNPPELHGFSDEIHADRGGLRVNDNLQLAGYPHIFVGGDVTSIDEEKTAQNAEHHAEVIAENVLRTVKGRQLADYERMSGPLIISLGGRCGIMTYRRRYLCGLIPGLLKWGVEYGILAQYRRLGDWF